MLLLELSLFPLDQGASVSRYVAGSLDIIDRSGVPYQCHAMGTTLEGSWDEVFAVVRQCFDAMAVESDRIECTIKIDYRNSTESRLRAKVARIEEQLGREVVK